MKDLPPSDRKALLNGGLGDDIVLGVRDGDLIIGESKAPEIGLLGFEVGYVRRDRYGVHGETKIKLGDRVLTHSMINLSKHEDRTKLSNTAADNLGNKDHGKLIRLRLDHFASKVWDWWTQTGGPTRIEATGFEAPRFLLDPYIVEGGITMLYGPPKSGKSYMGLIWALTLTHGANVWGGNESRVPVAFVNLERPPNTVGYRVQRLAAALGCPTWLDIQHEKGRKFTDVSPATIGWLKEHEGALVVVDSLSRMGSGNLNDNEDTNRAMDLLHGLKASVVVLAHTPRSDASHVFGSVMHDAAADVLVRCEKAKGEHGLMGVRLTVDDGNDVSWSAPKTWALSFDGPSGLSEIRLARPADFPDLTDVRPLREQAKDYLEAVGSATVADICDGIDCDNPKSLAKALHREPDWFVVATEGGRGKGSQNRWSLVRQAISGGGGGS